MGLQNVPRFPKSLKTFKELTDALIVKVKVESLSKRKPGMSSEEIEEATIATNQDGENYQLQEILREKD